MTEGSDWDGVRISEMPPEERPRERLSSLGAAALRNAELIAILLRTGIPGSSAVQIAERLLSRFGSLNDVAKASLSELQMRGIGREKAVALHAAFALARRMASEIREDTPLMDNPQRSIKIFREEFLVSVREEFRVALLNARMRLIRLECVMVGGVDSLMVHPREVFRSAIISNAVHLVIAHNHPSGDPSPSHNDIQLTRDFVRAGHLLKIPIVDHLIVGTATSSRPRDYVSMRELGYCG